MTRSLRGPLIVTVSCEDSGPYFGKTVCKAGGGPNPSLGGGLLGSGSGAR